MTPVLALALALAAGLQASSGEATPAGAAAPRAPDLEALARRYGDRWTPEARAYQIAGPAVVSIQSFRRESRGRVSLPPAALNQGTGIVVDEAGFVITNAHVVAPDDRIALETIECRLDFGSEFGGRKVLAEVLRVDREWDLALLRIVEPGPFYALALSPHDDLLIGERVLAIGAPYGGSLSLTAGLLSGVGRDIRVSAAQGRSFLLAGVLQTDAAINPGNSGGPLLNVRGECIGLCSAMLRDAEGVSYAIPASRVLRILDERLFEPLVWHGLEFTPGSLAIAGVHPRGPAAASGLRAGDVLDECDGQPLADPAAWRRRLALARAGDLLRLSARRPGGGSIRAEVGLVAEATRQRLGLLGFDAREEQFQVPVAAEFGGRPVNLLRVQEVFAGSGAESLGLEHGDTIVAVHLTNGANVDGWVPVRSLDEIVSHLSGGHFDFAGLNLWWVKPDGSSLKGRLTFDDPALPAQARS